MIFACNVLIYITKYLYFDKWAVFTYSMFVNSRLSERSALRKT